MAWALPIRSANAGTGSASGAGPTLAEIMGEQLAGKLHEADQQALIGGQVDHDQQQLVQPVEEEEEDADLVFAQQLQREEELLTGVSLATEAHDSVGVSNSNCYMNQNNSSNSSSSSVTGQQHKAEQADADKDFALALQLQEEEECQAHADYEARLQHARQRMSGKVFVRPRAPVGTNEQVHHFHTGQLQMSQVDDDGDSDARGDYEDVGGVASDHSEGEGRKSTRGPFWPRRDKSIKGQGGDAEIITKHDPNISGRRNVHNLSATLSSSTHTGDLTGVSGASRGSKLKVSNTVFNKLKAGLKKQENATKGLSSTVEKDRFQTYAKGLDHQTRLILHRMVNTGVLEEVNGVVRTGKEASVYHALGTDQVVADGPGVAPGHQRKQTQNHDEEEDETQEATQTTATTVTTSGQQRQQQHQHQHRGYAVKVFRTTLDGFKNRMAYIQGDHRFGSYGQLKRQNPRKIVRVWAEKEFKNLTRMHRSGIPCPEPWRLHENVLVMGFIGRDGWPAPQLKEVDISQKRLRLCYLQLVLAMRMMYQEAQIVHADLSEFNVLVLSGKVFVIDVGQAVERDHPDALQYLERDCRNVTAFFRARGVPHVCDPEILIGLVTAKQNELERLNKEAGAEAGTEAGTREIKTDGAMLKYARSELPWAHQHLECARRLDFLLTPQSNTTTSTATSDVGVGSSLLVTAVESAVDASEHSTLIGA